MSEAKDSVQQGLEVVLARLTDAVQLRAECLEQDYNKKTPRSVGRGIHDVSPRIAHFAKALEALAQAGADIE